MLKVLNNQNLEDNKTYYAKEDEGMIFFYNKADRLIMLMAKQDWLDILKWTE